MKLYRLIVEDRARYVATQADARALKRATGATWSATEVPTHKAGLLAFLNEHSASVSAPAAPAPRPTAPPAAPPPALPLALDAASVLARMDNPDIAIDALVEAIAGMKGGYALKRVAGAVAVRFEELSR